MHVPIRFVSFHPAWWTAAIACVCLAGTPGHAATFNQLTYVGGSSRKVEQLVGDHDWADTTRTVRSTTLTRADVLGNDVGVSFMAGDSLIMLFGDTIGATQQYVPGWADSLNAYKWNARDPIAWSTTSQPDSALLLNFFTNSAGDSTLIVAPVYADGSQLAMGIDDVPNAGIALDNKLFLVCKTGAVSVGGVTSNDGDSSVVVRFHPRLGTFDALRTLSRLGDGGHFLTTALCELPAQFASSPADSEVLVFGLGPYRKSDVYLAKIPRADFASGVDGTGNSAMRYFAGLVNGQPAWSDSESASVPVVQDDPLTDTGIGVPQRPWPNDTPTIGNLSVAWSPALGVWLMLYDGGRQQPYAEQTKGVYFTYSASPWGPWLRPQMIFNSGRDGGYGAFMRLWNSATQTGIGPAGPTIGDQAKNDPDSTTGGIYAPGILSRFIRVTGDTLELDYTLSTWNPYTIVRMTSAFLVQPGPLAVPATLPVPARLVVSPNPFRSSTHLRFTVPRRGAVDVAVYDLGGRRVRQLYRGVLAPGEHALEWDGASDGGAPLRAGLYFIRLRAPGSVVGSRTVWLGR